MADPDITKLNFWSGENYMKREARPARYQDVVVPVFGTKTFDVYHGLNRYAQYEVGAELVSDGVIWTATLPYIGMSGSGGGATPVSVVLDSWMGLNALTILLTNPFAGARTVRVYYEIYRDYE